MTEPSLSSPSPSPGTPRPRRAVPRLTPRALLPPTFPGSQPKPGPWDVTLLWNTDCCSYPGLSVSAIQRCLIPPLCPLWNRGWDSASWFMAYSQPSGSAKVSAGRHGVWGGVSVVCVRCSYNVEKNISWVILAAWVTQRNSWQSLENLCWRAGFHRGGCARGSRTGSVAGDNAAVSAHIFSPSCEFPGFCVLELNPDVSSPSPPPSKYPQTKRESNPSSLLLSGGDWWVIACSEAWTQWARSTVLRSVSDLLTLQRFGSAWAFLARHSQKNVFSLWINSWS